MKSLLRNLENIIFWAESKSGVKQLHTIIIALMFVIIASLIGWIAYLTNSSDPVLANITSDILRFLFMVVIAGIIMSVTSNYFYDKIKDAFDDPIKRSIIDSKLLNIFLPDKELDKKRRDEITIDRLKHISGDVHLIGIAATSYLPLNYDASPFSELFAKKLLTGEINLRLLLLNPYSQAAKFRFAREQGDDVDAVGEKNSTVPKYEDSAFYTDIKNTILKVNELKRKGANIDCRLTNFEPSISMMLTNEFVYLDILSLGRFEETGMFTKQRSTLPILEYSPKSQYYRVAKSHFEYHWRYSITTDEFSYYRSEFKSNFYNHSLTGYRLIKQHESWISVDPIVGCNNNCNYCILQTTFRNNKKPDIYTSLELIGERLRESKYYNEEAVISLFNYTDALLPENREHLIKCLDDLNNKGFKNWVCIPTKMAFDGEFADRLIEAYPNGKLIFLISLSGLPRKHEPKISPEGLIDTMKLLKEKGVPVIHYWRPITHENCDEEQIKRIISTVALHCECSVVVGLKASNALNDYYSSKFLIQTGEEKEHGDYMPPKFIKIISDVQKIHHKNHPVYFHASCAVSKIAKRPDYNGTMFRSDVCSMTGSSFCTNDQEKICQQFKEKIEKNFNENEYISIIRDVNPDMEIRIVDQKIELLNPISQDDFIHLVHRTKLPIKANKILHTNQYVGSLFDI